MPGNERNNEMNIAAAPSPEKSKKPGRLLDFFGNKLGMRSASEKYWQQYADYVKADSPEATPQTVEDRATKKTIEAAGETVKTAENKLRAEDAKYEEMLKSTAGEGAAAEFKAVAEADEKLVANEARGAQGELDMVASVEETTSPAENDAEAPALSPEQKAVYEAAFEAMRNYQTTNVELRNAQKKFKELKEKLAPEMYGQLGEVHGLTGRLHEEIKAIAAVPSDKLGVGFVDITSFIDIIERGIPEINEEINKILLNVIDTLDPGMYTGRDLYTREYVTYVTALQTAIDLHCTPELVQKAKHVLFELPKQENIEGGEGVFSRYDELVHLTLERHLMRKIIKKTDNAADVKEIMDVTAEYDNETKVDIIAAVLAWRHDSNAEDLQKNLDTLPLPPNFKIDTYVSAWKRSAEEHRDVATATHLRRVMEVAAKEPEAIEVLTKQFGIKDFGRYDAEMLLRQYQERDNDEEPYGIVVYPESDHNGAFFHDKDKLKKVADDLGDTHLLRIVEANNKIGVVKQLLKLRKKYPSHKFSFAIIGGHGTKDSIQFGSPYEHNNNTSHIHTEDLAGPGAGRTAGFFEKGGTIILESCSTGKSGGIAEKLSEVLGVQVVAPDVPTSTKEINVQVKNGAPHFTIEFEKKESLQMYSAGTKK